MTCALVKLKCTIPVLIPTGRKLVQNKLYRFFSAKIEQKALNNDRVKGNLIRRVACITHVRQKTDMLQEEVSFLTTECRSLDHNIHRLKEELTHVRKKMRTNLGKKPLRYEENNYEGKEEKESKE